MSQKDGLEVQVRSFNEKRALKENIEVHRQRKEWALLDEYREAIQLSILDLERFFGRIFGQILIIRLK